MSHKVGLITGSFDPITLGHLDIIERATALFDSVYVAVVAHPKKHTMWSLEKRHRHTKEVLAHMPGVEVVTAQDTLTVELAQTLGVTHLVRGIRDSRDLDYERQLETYNRFLEDTLETVYFLAKPEMAHISSSSIKELLHYHRDVSSFVPAIIQRELNHDLHE